MARRKKAKGGDSGPAWLVTFSDLMTLLLTFFVLLLSMSSMDTTTLARISASIKGTSLIDNSGAGRIPERIEILVKLLKDPQNVLNKLDRIKDLLFPLDVLPPEISSSTLEENLSILAHPEGVVIVLTDALLFEQGSAELDAKGKKLIDVLTPVILATNADANISGYTDSTPGTAVSNDDLSALRSMAILERFLYGGIRPDRFSISGYGADKPMFPNTTEEGRRKNRRVEILLKTAPRVGSYVN